VKAEDLDKPCLPVAYGLITLDQAAARGVSREAMLAGLNFPPGLLDAPDAKLSVLQYSRLILNALKLTQDPGLGLEFGLRCNLTAHGFWTYGVMTHSTAREASEYAIKYLQLSAPNVHLRLFTEGASAVLEAREAIPFGPLRHYTFEMFLVTIWRVYQSVASQLPSGADAAELWFEWPEPAYYARFGAQLPGVRFGTGVNQLRFPAEYLDRRLTTANPMTARLVEERARQEMLLLGHGKDFLDRVRAAVVNRGGAYPDLEAVARTLFVSSRTLKRKLQEHRVSFRELLDEVRHRDSVRLLQDATLSIEDVAVRVGYTDPANFTRAFRKWTGAPPNVYRAKLKPAPT
jgi:AraC-like DNA-binding protein